MKVIEKESSYWPGQEYIIVEATEEERQGMLITEYRYCGGRAIESGFDKVMFIVPKNFRTRLFVSKSNCFKVGDDISLSWLLSNFSSRFSAFKYVELP